jgi:PPK2 family polyphosphate:nucleotide phosphotransferase
MASSPFLIKPGSKVSLKDHNTQDKGPFKDKSEAKDALKAGVERLAKYQDLLYAANTHAVLLVFQAMDAAGKDSTIKHVMSGVNPQGCQVFSFKAPSAEEQDHTYLWRNMKALPERGRIGIFNRSYYEEVLVVRVHPEFLAGQQLPEALKTDKGIWKQRFKEINNFEEHLTNNGVTVIKFFLNVSKAEQKQRFLDRIDRPEKNWKFSLDDLKERALWDKYQQAYEDMLSNTSTEAAPWYVIPADDKNFMRWAVAEIVGDRLKALKLKYPEVSEAHRQQLQQAKAALEAEED